VSRIKMEKISVSSDGFTLVEALFSVVLLGVMATAIAVPYISGFQSLDVQANRMLVDYRQRGKLYHLLDRDKRGFGRGFDPGIQCKAGDRNNN
jgi:Tfp pilus assembly protein PilE